MATTSTSMLFPGDTLGGYRILDIIGIGGMAVVYRAEQVSLGREVALKVLAPELSRDEEFRERFRREGKNVAALDHTNIVTIHDSGESGGRFYIAMRLVKGPTLADRMHEGMNANDVLRILVPIADALDTAHSIGLVHRDVKPQNILLSGRGEVYLADFGVAKSGRTQGLTATGSFVGSFNYAAPEQALGEATSEATDVYSLTAVLFQCLTGQVPYPRETDAGVLIAHISAPPPLVVGPQAERFNAIIARGLAKDPTQRYPSAGALLADVCDAVALLTPAEQLASPVLYPAAGQTQTLVPPVEGKTPAPGDASSVQQPIPPELTAPADDTRVAPADEVPTPAAEVAVAGAGAVEAAAAAAGGAEVADGAGQTRLSAPADGTTRSAPAPVPADGTKLSAPVPADGTKLSAPPDPVDGTKLSAAPDGTKLSAPDNGTKVSTPADATKATAPSSSTAPLAAASSEAAPPPARKPSADVVKRRRAVAIAAIAGLAVAAVAVIAIVSSSGSSPRKAAASGAAKTAPALSASNAVSAGPFQIAYNAPWQRSDSPVVGSSALQGSTITLSDGQASLAAGALAASAVIPGAVPPALVRSYGQPGASVDGSVARGQGRSYTWAHGAEKIVAYVLPAAAGDTAIICAGPSSSPAGNCAALAAAATPAASVQVLAPGPDRAVGAALAARLRPVAAARTAAGSLSEATLAARAAPAQRVVLAERRAVAAIRRLAIPGRYQTAIARLSAALAAEASAFATLASAARADDRSGYSGSVAGVHAASGRLAAAARAIAPAQLQVPRFGPLSPASAPPVVTANVVTSTPPVATTPAPVATTPVAPAPAPAPTPTTPACTKNCVSGGQ